MTSIRFVICSGRQAVGAACPSRRADVDISNLSAVEIGVQATIAVFMIVNPIDPVEMVSPIV